MGNSDHHNATSADNNIAHQYQTHPMTGSGLMSSSQQAKPEGLDYSLQRSGEVYSSSHMLSQNRTHIPNQSLDDRRSANSNQVYGSYEHSSQAHPSMNYSTTASSAGPNNNMGASNTLSQMSKVAAANSSSTSNSPPQSTWTPRHLQRVCLLNHNIDLIE